MIESIYVYLAMLIFACIGAFYMSKKITERLVSKVFKREIDLTVVDKKGTRFQKTFTLDPKNKDDDDLMAYIDTIKKNSPSDKVNDDERQSMSEDLAEWIAINRSELFLGEKPTENLINAINVAVKNYEMSK